MRTASPRAGAGQGLALSVIGQFISRLGWATLCIVLVACSRSPAPSSSKTKRASKTASAPAIEEVQRALGLGFGGYATLAFDAGRLGRDHTVALRFMPAFEGAYRGVVFADESGRYRVGMAPYASLNQPALEVSLAGATFTSPLPSPLLSNHDVRFGAPPQPPARWLSLVVSVRGDDAQIFLNGESVGTLTFESHDFSGKLFLGRLARSLAVQDQFYGFIDDVAIFERALDAPEVRALSRVARIDVRLAGLAALADFDERAASSVRLIAALSGTAELTAVSNERDARTDGEKLPRAAGPALTLPFARGQVWMVVQGINSAGSHHDTAAFALDFQRVDPTLVAHNPEHRGGASASLSVGQPFLALAAGKVVSSVDCFGDDNRALCPGMKPSANGDPEHAHRNLVCVEHATAFVSCYLHLKASSARLRAGATVPAGAVLGLVGQTGTNHAHLHVAVSDRAEPNEPGTFNDLTTVPFEFRDYEASNDFGHSWQLVRAGTPSPGQWLRRP